MGGPVVTFEEPWPVDEHWWCTPSADVRPVAFLAHLGATRKILVDGVFTGIMSCNNEMHTAACVASAVKEHLGTDPAESLGWEHEPELEPPPAGGEEEQLRLIEPPDPEWRLDERTKRVGLEGVRSTRRILEESSSLPYKDICP